MSAQDIPITTRIPPGKLLIEYVPGADHQDDTSKGIKAGVDSVITRWSPLYEKASLSTQRFKHIGVYHSKLDGQKEPQHNLLIFKSFPIRDGIYCQFHRKTGWKTLEDAIENYTWMWQATQPGPIVVGGTGQISFPEPLPGDSADD